MRKDLKEREEKGNTEYGLPAHISPFYGLVQLYAYNGNELPPEQIVQIKELIAEVVEAFQKRIDIVNF